MKQFSALFSLLFVTNLIYSQVDLSQGLVAYYPFNGNAQDASGNNLHGFLRNGASPTTDMYGQANKAMAFDGVDDYVEILDDPKLRFTNQFSIAFLFNRHSSSKIAELIEKRDWFTGSQSSFDIGLVEDGKVRTAIKTGNDCSNPTSNWVYPTVSDVTIPDVWYCVVAVFKDGKLDFYLNGNLIGTNTTSYKAIDNCSGSNIRLGIHLSFDPLAFKGKMDEVRLYNRPLNMEEISQLCVISTPCDINPPKGEIEPIAGCENTPLQVNFKAQGKGPFSIVLKYNNEIFEKSGVENGQTLDLGNKLVFPAKEVQLISITDADGCKNEKSTKSASIVYKKPQLEFQDPGSFCQDDKSLYKLNASEITLAKGNGYFSGSELLPDGTFSPSTMKLGNNMATYYFTSEDGCEDSVSSSIIINPIPIANAGNDVVACLNTNIQLNGSGGTEYHWLPENGLSDPSAANPTVTVTGPAVYELTVKNETGCIKKDTVEIKIVSGNKDYFNLPNAFSPNNDGRNDCFGIQHWGDAKIKEFSIFNRWGQKVFTTKNPSRCWDGNTNGHRAEAGTYVYKIEAITSCGEVSRHGTVTIIK